MVTRLGTSGWQGYGTDGMSSQQFTQSLSLLLGLQLHSLPTPDGRCKCLAPLSAFGYHQLNYSKLAGQSWKKGYDIVVKALAFEIQRLGMGAVDSDFTMKNDYAHPISQKWEDFVILLSHLKDTFNSPMLWINTWALILLLMLKSVLWLLEMGIGRPESRLTKLCLRTIPLHRQRMKSFGSTRPIMLLWVLPFFLLFLAVLAKFVPWRLNFYALWIFWNLDSSMILFRNVLAEPSFTLVIAPS